MQLSSQMSCSTRSFVEGSVEASKVTAALKKERGGREAKAVHSTRRTVPAHRCKCRRAGKASTYCDRQAFPKQCYLALNGHTCYSKFMRVRGRSPTTQWCLSRAGQRAAGAAHHSFTGISQ